MERENTNTTWSSQILSYNVRGVAKGAGILSLVFLVLGSVPKVSSKVGRKLHATQHALYLWTIDDPSDMSALTYSTPFGRPPRRSFLVWKPFSSGSLFYAQIPVFLFEFLLLISVNSVTMVLCGYLFGPSTTSIPAAGNESFMNAIRIGGIKG